MRALLLLLVVALATNAFGDDLTGRLQPLGDPDQRILAAVYDRYPSGRPRRVVATFGNVGEGKLLLVRFPDSDGGKPRVLDRQELESGPGEERIETIIDPKDIVVELNAKHGSSAPGKPFKTEEDCHVIALHGAGPKTRVFLEELP